jgi:predicted transcriptional regulator
MINYDYDYVYDNGTKKKRNEAIKDILEFVGDGAYHMNEIAKGIGLNYTSTTSLVRWLRRNKKMFGTRIGRKYIFRVGNIDTQSECLLADLLYPKDKILKLFKIKSVQTRHVEDAPNVTILAKGGGVRYTDHVFNTVYD